MFAANGTRLGFIQSDELRTPVSWSEIPTNLKNATVAIEDQRFYKNDGVDLTGIFRAAVKDVTNGAAAAGRLDDHDAADAQPLPRRRPAHAQAEDHRGQAGARVQRTPQQALDPHQLPQQRPLRHGRRADGGRRAGGRAHLLRQAGLPAGPRAVGAARRPAAGALAVQPVPRLLRGPAQRRNEVLAKMAELHYISSAQASAAERAPLEVHHGNFYSQRSERSSSNTCASSSIHRYGTQDRRTGRAEGLHDDRPEHAAPGAQGDRRSARRARRPRLGDRHDQPAQRRHRGDGRVRELREVPVQPRRRRAPPARLDVQGDRPRRRALARDRPEQHLLPLAHAARPAGCPATRPTK